MESVDRNTSGRIRLSGLAPFHMMRGARANSGGRGRDDPSVDEPPYSAQPLCRTPSIPCETPGNRRIGGGEGAGLLYALCYVCNVGIPLGTTSRGVGLSLLSLCISVHSD